ncbi:MAG: YgjV family protein [Ruminococcaceae bacterium]|nr:YgjV family protein [Oscillospiraceae bacterium]
MEIIAQILGIAGVIVYFFAFQAKTYKKLMIIQTITATIFCVHYLLLNATSALALNIVIILRNIVYYNNDKKFFSCKLFPFIFAAIMVGISVFSWEDYYSLYIIAGLALNTLFTSLPNSQTIRKSILITSPLVFVYNIFVFSIGGMINEAIAVISSIIGIIRYKKSKNVEQL